MVSLCDKPSHPLCLIVILTCAQLCGFAQSRPANFSAHADLVLVNTTVLNSKSQFVTGLTRSDFVLRVDRKATPIAAFSLETEPVSAAVVVDASRSMKKAVMEAQAALGALLGQAWPEDEYGLIICQNSVQSSVPLTQDFGRILEMIPLLKAAGSTPLYDSIADAIGMVRKGHNAKKVVIAITDGEDTSSRLPLLGLYERLEEADVHLYVIQFWDGSVSDDRFALRDATENTGGSFFGDVRRKDLVEVMARLDVHWQYVIAFRPLAIKRKPVHAIEIRLKSEAGAGKFQIFCRHQFTEDSLVR